MDPKGERIIKSNNTIIEEEMNVVLNKSYIAICKKTNRQKKKQKNTPNARIRKPNGETHNYKYLPVCQSDLVKGTLLDTDALFLLLTFEKQIPFRFSMDCLHEKVICNTSGTYSPGSKRTFGIC